MELYLNATLFLLTLIGGTIPLWWPAWNEKLSQNLNIFSGAFLFSVCLSHLLPETFESGLGHIPGMLVVVGFFLQFFIQKFTHGLEHGHQCHHDHSKSTAWTLFTGMVLHSFMEGLPLSSGFFSYEALVPLYAAILLHKIPAAIIMANLFLLASVKKYSILIILALFSLVVPIGAFTGFALTQNIEGFTHIIHWIIPIVTGSFLQIATTILFEASSRQHSMSRRAWILILTGAAMGGMSGLLHSH